MYELVVTAHSWLRWVALIAGVMAVVMAAAAPSRADRWGLILVIALDLQFLLGFALVLRNGPLAGLGAPQKTK